MTEEGTLRARLESDVRAAMKARDKTTVSVLRSLIGAIDNAGAVEAGPARPPVVNERADVPRRELSEAEIIDVVAREAAELRSALEAYDARGQSEKSAALRIELAVLSRYLES